jgi:hypothetical protein
LLIAPRMNSSHRFRQLFLRRLLAIATLGASTSGLVVAAVGCGGKVVVDGGSGGSSASSASFTTGAGTTTQCFDWGTASACPDEIDAPAHLMLTCDQAVIGPAEVVDGQCCYPVSLSGNCAIAGRPFLVEARAVTAEVRRGGGASSWAAAPQLPDVSELSPSDRAALATAWLDDARMEHASVASFARFSMDLLAVGAPADLVAAAHEAALDEIRHARLCFALAGAYAGEALAPAAFPFGGPITPATDLASMAAAAVREGCIGETLAALQAAEQLAHATDPAVRAALTTIAEDEAAHAELAWRAVTWALAQGGEPVRCAVAAAFAELPRIVAAAAPASGSADLTAHGRPDRLALHASLRRSVDDVVGLCARTMLGELGAAAAS